MHDLYAFSGHPGWGDGGETEALTVQLWVNLLSALWLTSSQRPWPLHFSPAFPTKVQGEASKAPESLKLLARLGTVWPCSRNSAHSNKHLP